MDVKKNWTSFKTIIFKELRRSLRVWSQTFIPPIITTTLYYIVFGYIIGKRIGMMGGYSYIEFIAPGLIMLSIINSAYNAAVASFFLAKFQKSIEEILISPTSNTVILLGYMCGGMMRAILVGALVTIISLFFTHMHVHSLFYVILVSLLAAAIFSLGGIINAIYAKTFDDTTYIPTFVLTPLIYLGGVFFPITLLPANWQYVALLNPIFYIIQSFRYGFLGLLEHKIYLSFVIMAIFAISLGFFAWSLLQKGVGMRE